MNREDYIAKAPTFTIYDGFCKTKSVLENHSRIIVSVSGGSDSDDMVDIAEHLKPDDASPSNQGVRCRLVNFTILDGKEEKNLPRIGSWRSDDI